MRLTEKLTERLFGREPDFSLIVTTTKTDDGRYESSVEMNEESPIIKVLGKEYVDRVKGAHLKHLQKFPKSRYIQSRIGNGEKVH